MTLLKPHLVSTAGKCAISVVSLQLVTTQFHQLVSEYVVRGRVYSQLFAKQEVETNSLSLSPVPPTATVLEAERSFASTSTERFPLPSQQVFSSRNLSCKDARREEALSSSPQSGARAGGLGFLGIGSSGSTEAPSAAHGADGARITKPCPDLRKAVSTQPFCVLKFCPGRSRHTGVLGKCIMVKSRKRTIRACATPHTLSSSAGFLSSLPCNSGLSSLSLQLRTIP